MTRTRVALGLDAFSLVGLYAVVWAILRGSLLAQHPEIMAVAVAVDLVVTAPILHYLLGVRFGGLPAWTVSVVAVVGAAVAARFVPGSESVWLIAGLLVAVELALGGFVAWRLLRLVREGRRARASGANVLEALETGLAESLESRVLAAAVMAEVQLVFYGIFGVFRRAPSGPGTFTVHREIGWVWMAGSLVGISCVEVPVLHVLLDMYVAGWLAWVVTFVSAYSVLWLWGDAQAMRLVPTQVHDGVLQLRVGLRWQADIPLTDIVGVEIPEERAAVDVSVLGEPNALLVLGCPVRVRGPFGLTRTGDRLSLQLDDVAGLARAVGRPLA